MVYITVCTPTYNRGYLLNRPFNSLKSQTFKNFEWLIIDDGSTDDTKEIIEKFKKEADFTIRYIYQKNQGRAAALNTSYKYIKSKYVMNLDSDDEYTPNTLKIIYDIWENMDKEMYDRVWCITGSCIDSETRKRIGKLWPKNINKLKGRKQHKMIIKYKKGERCCCRKVNILRQYPFPIYKETKFVSENVVWEKINQRYDQYCTNEIFRIYYTNSNDSLSIGKDYDSVRKITFYYLALFYINECSNQIFYNPSIFFSFFDISRCALITKRDYRIVMKEIKSIWKRILVTLTYPVTFIFIKIYYKH